MKSTMRFAAAAASILLAMTSVACSSDDDDKTKPPTNNGGGGDAGQIEEDSGTPEEDGSTPEEDSGTPEKDGSTPEESACAEEEGDTECITCIKTDCCEALKACKDNDACSGALDTAGECLESNDLTSCATQFVTDAGEDGSELANDLLECLDTSCTAKCGGDPA